MAALVSNLATFTNLRRCVGLEARAVACRRLRAGSAAAAADVAALVSDFELFHRNIWAMCRA